MVPSTSERSIGPCACGQRASNAKSLSWRRAMTTFCRSPSLTGCSPSVNCPSLPILIQFSMASLSAEYRARNLVAHHFLVITVALDARAKLLDDLVNAVEEAQLFE